MKNIFSMLFMAVLLSTMALPSQATLSDISNTDEKGNEIRVERTTEFSNVVYHVVSHIKMYFAESCEKLGTPPKDKVCICKPLLSIYSFVRNTCFFVSKTIIAAESATQAAKNNLQHSTSKWKAAEIKSLTKKITNAEFIGDVCN